MRELALLLMLSLVSACGFFSKTLTDQEVEQYIKAYQNIAEASPKLSKQKESSHSTTLLTCLPCHDTLRDAVVKAGYADVKSFLIADARMHLALNYYYHLELARLAGDTTHAVKAQDFCQLTDSVNASQDPKQAKLICQKITTTTSYLKKIGDVIYKIAESLLQEGDAAVVAKHAEAIQQALSNEHLVDDFRHVSQHGLDD